MGLKNKVMNLAGSVILGSMVFGCGSSQPLVEKPKTGEEIKQEVIDDIVDATYLVREEFKCDDLAGNVHSGTNYLTAMAFKNKDGKGYLVSYDAHNTALSRILINDYFGFINNLPENCTISQTIVDSRMDNETADDVKIEREIRRECSTDDCDPVERAAQGFVMVAEKELHIPKYGFETRNSAQFAPGEELYRVGYVNSLYPKAVRMESNIRFGYHYPDGEWLPGDAGGPIGRIEDGKFLLVGFCFDWSTNTTVCLSKNSALELMKEK